MGTELVWRLDDDTVPESNVLENLLSHMTPTTGAVGGSILTVPNQHEQYNWRSITGVIDDVRSEPNLQWFRPNYKQKVEHLHCSFLYRAGIVDYFLGLSRLAHTEETLFTWMLHKKGYDIYVIPNTVTWHLMNSTGGNRDKDIAKQEFVQQDSAIFNNLLYYKNNTIVILNCGMGDHVVFKHMMHEIKNPVIFTCYPEIVPGEPIIDAIRLFGPNLDNFNVYKKMNDWEWKGSLEEAFKRMCVWCV